MDQSSDSVGFSFGSVQDTIIDYHINQQIQIGKLPFNPFVFDLSLELTQSPQNYEQKGAIFNLSNNLNNIFGRKSKKKKAEQELNLNEQKFQFLAQTLSRRHFIINKDHMLKDNESMKGTYFWIQRNSPKFIQINDEYLLNDLTLKINDINKNTQKIQIQIQTTILTLNPKKFSERLFLIGSSKKCHFVKNNLNGFHIGLDLYSLTLHNLIQDQDCSLQNGTWLKVKQPIKIQGNDIIMAGSYIFTVKW